MDECLIVSIVHEWAVLSTYIKTEGLNADISLSNTDRFLSKMRERLCLKYAEVSRYCVYVQERSSPKWCSAVRCSVTSTSRTRHHQRECHDVWPRVEQVCCACVAGGVRWSTLATHPLNSIPNFHQPFYLHGILQLRLLCLCSCFYF